MHPAIQHYRKVKRGDKNTGELKEWNQVWFRFFSRVVRSSEQRFLQSVWREILVRFNIFPIR